MATELWTPVGTAYNGINPAGRNMETGSQIVSHQIRVEAKDLFGKVHKQIIRVLADDDTSQSEIEDMMGHAAENFVTEVREKYTKRPPTEDERKQIGKALNEYLNNRTKRRESTSNKIYF
tara:strand:+ start:520 stop:879 length:360 start_codon:yes stop_codon:yes gene_type:complete